MVMAGPVVTVSLPPDDNLMVHAAVERCEPGDVLLVVPTAPSSCAMVGELLATSLGARGIAGLVIDAGIRDVAALRAVGFPVWASLITAAGATKANAGSVNVSVRCGDVDVRPGDVIVADDDGVVAVSASRAVAVLGAATTRMAAEDERRIELASGSLGLDLYDLRPLLDRLGVATVDEADGQPTSGTSRA
jgi:4-hydroxy-4-methyl-2-oxoglutarate aldolase